MLSDVMEDYLKAIFTLQGETEPPIPPSRIATRLDVTAPTVTSMMETLEERGLVEREKYAGVELTEEGETVALEILRHHRLLEAYLAEHLDYEWSEVHAEAEILEHHISEEFERRVAEVLDHPQTDPHGDPIPGTDLEPVREDTEPLSAFGPEDRLRICRVRDDDPEILSHLAAIGIEPGVEVVIRAVTPLSVYQVEVGGDRRHLPESTAEVVYVRPTDDREADTPREAGRA